MAKINNTRKQRADVLYERVAHGPSIQEPLDGSPLTAAYVTEVFQRWAKAWILDELKSLVPELRAGQRRR